MVQGTAAGGTPLAVLSPTLASGGSGVVLPPSRAARQGQPGEGGGVRVGQSMLQGSIQRKGPFKMLLVADRYVESWPGDSTERFSEFPCLFVSGACQVRGNFSKGEQQKKSKMKNYPHYG